jgi:hypothetical protein
MSDTSFRLIIRQTINPGGLEEFKTCCQLSVGVAEADAAGTLGYKFFLNDEGTEAYLMEHYANSEAFIAHLAAVGPILERSMKCSTLVEAIVLGDPTPEARAALSQLGAKVFANGIGFCR